MWKTPAEAALEIELQKTKRELDLLKLELDPLGVMPPVDVHEDDFMTMADPPPKLQLEKHSTFKASHNTYGAVLVQVRNTAVDHLQYEYYISGLNSIDTTNNINILAECHKKFVRQLAEKLLKEKF